jgi:hypothetical protein
MKIITEHMKHTIQLLIVLITNDSSLSLQARMGHCLKDHPLRDNKY